MTRREALKILIAEEIKALTHEERAERLWEMTCEGWWETEEWENLPKETRTVFERKEMNMDTSDPQFDAVLNIHFSHQFRPVKNEYISQKTGLKITQGEPELFHPCPCCGYRTIEFLSDFDICTVCWWEDDGQENLSGNCSWGGPNEVTLTQARYNFLTYSLYNPDRKDLMEFKGDPEKYLRGREFYLLNKSTLAERNTQWKSSDFKKS